MTEGCKVKIFTRSFDLRLYNQASGLWEGIECDGRVRLTDKSADGYFYAMLREQDCDIAINIDEDAFVCNPDAVNDLVRLMIAEGYANIGCADAGEGLPRNGNPKVTNPFFNILDLRQIRSKFDRCALKAYDEHYEPYYPFFLWMADNFRTLYLSATGHPDGTTTVLFDPQGRTICKHSWYARFYSMPGFVVRRIQKDQGMQKGRIDSLISEVYAERGLQRPGSGWAQRCRFAADRTLRWIIKVPQRISRWPSKLMRKMKKSR
ncbi:MAG: hypothetical protein J5699_05320 [Bacteroidales bacterium]|nr:hypothetical protein [Bacteroidales bacterium]